MVLKKAGKTLPNVKLNSIVNLLKIKKKIVIYNETFKEQTKNVKVIYPFYTYFPLAKQRRD